MKKNELAILTTNAPLELVYSRNYREHRIKHLDSPDKIQELVNYLYVLLNVKKDNQLNELEESVLNGVMLNNFGNFSTDEIKHAFRLAVAGDLCIEMYQKLDSITLGKVIGAYKIYKAKKIKNYKSTTMSKEVNKPSKAEIKTIEEQFIQNCILPYIEERKTMSEPLINWATYAIFKHFWNLKQIKLTKAEIKKYKKEADKYWAESLKKRRSTGERVSLDEVMSQRTIKMYSSCIALYHKMDDILELVKIDEIGWHDKL